MTYALGIDLGTTYTAAAVARAGRAEVAALGYRATSVPTVVLLTDDGRFLVGDAAERRSGREPDRVAREFKRRVGDTTPLLLGGSPVAVDRCLAEVLAWVVSTIASTEGAPPAAVTVTHPANWGAFKRDILDEALRLAEMPGSGLLPEPVAAATWYAHSERLAAGATVAVYDLGGGTFDAAVLRRSVDGRFQALGRPEGIEHLGGIDVDHAVLAHVLRSVGLTAADLDGDGSGGGDDGAAVAMAMAQLRRACVEAKEALSSDTAVTIPVVLPGLHHDVLLQRSELEELVTPLLRPTVAALGRVVASAGLQPEDLDMVLLVGGSSRIPLIAREVSAGFARPIAVDAHPKHPVALGAALHAAAALARHVAASAPEVGGGVEVPHTQPAMRAPSGPPPPPPPPPPVAPAPVVPAPPPLAAQAASTADPPGTGLAKLSVVATPLVLILLIVLYVVQGRGETPRSSSSTSSATTVGQTSRAEDPSTTGEAPGDVDFLAKDVSPALAGFAQVGSKARDVTLYPEYAIAEIQDPSQSTHIDRYTWRDGRLEGPEPVSLTSSEVDELEATTFNLADIDPAVVRDITRRTLATCTGEGFELSHAILERELDDQLLFLVYASNPERGGGGYIAYTPDGTQSRDACN